MFRLATFLTWFVLCATGALAWGPGAIAALADGAVADRDSEATQVKEMRSRLARPVTLEQGFQANTTLREALEFLGDRHDIVILVDEQAFQTEHGEQVEKLKVQLPRFVGVKLSTVLRLILAQVHGTYLVRPDHVEIVPLEYGRPDFWKEKRELAPTVDVDFAERPLGEALHELSDASGINVVLDSRAGDKAAMNVTARLDNVPIDTAVLILADMAGLRSVALDNVLYVTTTENAEQVKGWHEKEPKEMSGSEKPSSPGGM